jgi:ligand-binding sensor domain-containing protein
MTLAAARGTLVGVLGALAGAVAVAPAQPPGPTLAQLAHTAWRLRDGAPATIQALAQSADGYLWVGAATGLYRFDGVRFERFEPPGGQVLPSLSVNALLALPDGALWIGYGDGGASLLAGGRLAHYGEREGMPRGTVTAFARDSAGTLWAATTRGLAHLAGDDWQQVGAERGYPGGMTADLLVDRRGTLWAAALAGVYVLPRGARRFAWRARSLDAGAGGGGMPREAPDGSVWGASRSRGLVRLSDSAGAPPRRAEHLRYPEGEIWIVLIDRRASAWLIGDYDGVVRVPLSAVAGRAGTAAPATWERRFQADGLSGRAVQTILEDREGSVWVGTDGGLDRFRVTKLTPVVWPRSVTGVALAAADGGAVWAGSYFSPLVAIGAGVTDTPAVPAGINCAHRDLQGGVWLGGPSGLWYQAPQGRAGSFARSRSRLKRSGRMYRRSRWTAAARCGSQFGARTGRCYSGAARDGGPASVPLAALRRSPRWSSLPTAPVARGWATRGIAWRASRVTRCPFSPPPTGSASAASPRSTCAATASGSAEHPGSWSWTRAEEGPASRHSGPPADRSAASRA